MNTARRILLLTSIGWVGCLAPSVQAPDHSRDAAARAFGLVQEVRHAAEPSLDVGAATRAGYFPFLGCVSGRREGAVCVRCVRSEMVHNSVLDRKRPEALTDKLRDAPLTLLGVAHIVME